MASFKDKSGLVWTLKKLDGPTILKLRRECDPRFLLNDEAEDNTAGRLGGDPALLCMTIFVLCEKERIDRKVEMEAFFENVIGDGETIEAAEEALEEELANFQSPRKRAFIAAIASKQREVERMGQEKVLAKINDPNLMENVSKHLDAEIDKILTRLGSATN